MNEKGAFNPAMLADMEFSRSKDSVELIMDGNLQIKKMKISDTIMPVNEGEELVSMICEGFLAASKQVMQKLPALTNPLVMKIPDHMQGLTFMDGMMRAAWLIQGALVESSTQPKAQVAVNALGYLRGD